MKYHRITFIGISILVLALLTFPTTAQDDESEIAFVRGWYSYNIAIVSSKGVVPVTNEQYRYSHLNTPQWSPDGGRIAFADDRNIYIVNVDGSNLVQLTKYDDPLSPRIANISWAADGQIIAATVYLENQDYGHYWIRLINTETSNEHDITSREYSDGFYGISWSPDGNFIVFSSNRDGFVPAATGLFVLNTETGAVSALTDISSRVRFDRYPSWSPDGSRIAFVSENFDDGRWNIYLIDADGSNLQRLTNQANKSEISDIANVRGTLDWSPNGDRIVFTACPNPYPEGCDLFTIRVDGTDLVQLTNDKENGDFDPSWKPKIVIGE